MVDPTEVVIDRLGPPAETQLVRQIRDAVLGRGRGGPVIDPDSVATLHRLSARSLTQKVQAALTTPIHLATSRLEVLGDSMPLVDAGGGLIARQFSTSSRATDHKLDDRALLLARLS